MKKGIKLAFGKDNLKMREYIYSLINFENVNSILDIGCKDGLDLRSMAKLSNCKAKLYGIDIRDRFINRAIENSKDFSNIQYLIADTSKNIPFEDYSFDMIYSLNVLECIEDKGIFLDEVNRVLKEDGLVVFCHFDWDSVIINGKDKPLIRKIVTAFADNQQDWMGSVDPWMGRRLLGEFNKTGKFEGSIFTYTITNSVLETGNYGYGMIKDFEDLVNDKLITREEYDKFHNEMLELNQSGEYFFSINMYIYVGKKA
ncbi:MAG: Methyltransferase type 11 [Haloplasmataceae bacterium]|jgi:ubiquinone/menaquinone biosynthesis C-methylase UbiE|nr:Methyltransferase type 11 [Haloplasmataceae bacterium]